MSIGKKTGSQRHKVRIKWIISNLKTQMERERERGESGLNQHKRPVVERRFTPELNAWCREANITDRYYWIHVYGSSTCCVLSFGTEVTQHIKLGP